MRRLSKNFFIMTQFFRKKRKAFLVNIYKKTGGITMVNKNEKKVEMKMKKLRGRPKKEKEGEEEGKITDAREFFSLLGIKKILRYKEAGHCFEFHFKDRDGDTCVLNFSLKELINEKKFISEYVNLSGYLLEERLERTKYSWKDIVKQLPEIAEKHEYFYRASEKELLAEELRQFIISQPFTDDLDGITMQNAAALKFVEDNKVYISLTSLSTKIRYLAPHLPAGIKKLAELLNYLGCKSVKIKRKGKEYRLWELPGSPEDWRFFEVPERNKINLDLISGFHFELSSENS